MSEKMPDISRAHVDDIGILRDIEIIIVVEKVQLKDGKVNDEGQYQHYAEPQKTTALRAFTLSPPGCQFFPPSWLAALAFSLTQLHTAAC